MHQSIINTKKPNQADVVILGANYDRTSSFGKGANNGPKAIVGCLDTQIEFYERFTQTEPAETAKIAYRDLGNLNKLFPERMVTTMSRELEKYYAQEKFIILLGGEHSVSNGAFHTLAKFHNVKNITILQIDAHADMRDTDADYNDKPHGKYAHSCVMRRAVEMGFYTVQVGIRAYSKDEYEFFSLHKKVKVYEWGKEKAPSIEAIIRSIPTKDVYLSIDVDGIDPSYMPATGTPVQGGLEWYYTIKLIQNLFQSKHVLAADIVEVAPRAYDRVTEYGAAQICYNIIAGKMVK